MMECACCQQRWVPVPSFSDFCLDHSIAHLKTPFFFINPFSLLSWHMLWSTWTNPGPEWSSSGRLRGEICSFGVDFPTSLPEMPPAGKLTEGPWDAGSAPRGFQGCALWITDGRGTDPAQPCPAGCQNPPAATSPFLNEHRVINWTKKIINLP